MKNKIPLQQTNGVSEKAPWTHCMKETTPLQIANVIQKTRINDFYYSMSIIKQ
jgi:hypothetical protein